jgi:transcriptional regulator with XRE-family HTH domain
MAATTDLAEIFGTNVRRLREGANESVIDAAARLGVGRQYWYLIERGETSPPFEKIERIAEMYGVTVRHLLEPPPKGGSKRRELAGSR